jgi:hypothetical protein
MRALPELRVLAQALRLRRLTELEVGWARKQQLALGRGLGSSRELGSSRGLLGPGLRKPKPEAELEA